MRLRVALAITVALGSFGRVAAAQRKGRVAVLPIAAAATPAAECRRWQDALEKSIPAQLRMTVLGGDAVEHELKKHCGARSRWWSCYDDDQALVALGRSTGVDLVIAGKLAAMGGGLRHQASLRGRGSGGRRHRDARGCDPRQPSPAGGARRRAEEVRPVAGGAGCGRARFGGGVARRWSAGARNPGSVAVSAPWCLSLLMVPSHTLSRFGVFISLVFLAGCGHGSARGSGSWDRTSLHGL